ncbi:MAG: AAA family ATPase [Acidobacteriia bacterium]|nr:AAA family ATPase [Terriglobia bacterium]
MPELSVVVLTTDEDQKALLQVLADGTAIARMSHSFGAYPQSSEDPVARRIQELGSDVVIVDLVPHDTPAALRTIEMLHATCPKSAIFAVGEMSQSQLIVNAMRAGAQEFLPRPTTIEHLLDAFHRLVSSQRKVRFPGVRGRVFVVLSAKGGSGATTVAVNLALALAAKHASTALLDMAPLGNVSLHLNVKPAFTMLDALQNLHRLDGALLDGFMTRHASGLHLLAGHPGVNATECGPTDFARLFDVVVNQYRYVVIDASTRLDPAVRALCDLSDSVLLVANPDLACLWSAARIHEFLAGSPAEQKTKLVLNRYKKKPFSDSDIEETTQTKILLKIPNQYALVAGSIEHGVPVVLQKRNDLARCYFELGGLLAADGQEPQVRGWLLRTASSL